MGLIVQKFGGTSVKDRNRIFNVARIVARTRNAGNDVVVVVSAQGDTTDDLIAKAAEISSNPSDREMDMLLSTGEQISIALLTMALQELGVSSISLTGWQAGFATDRAYTKARIRRINTERLESELARNRVVVVAGFQGLNRNDDITTLGRGGSDTSAVALAAALHADRCQIFTDVEGVYTADPRKIPKATKLKEITFDEMLELASLGAQVLNNRSVELAKKYGVELEVLSSLNPMPGTIVKEETKVEGMLIKGVAKDENVAVISILEVPDVPGMSFKVFSLLAQRNINVDIILQSSGRGTNKDLTFTVPPHRCPDRRAGAGGKQEPLRRRRDQAQHQLCQGLHRGCRHAEPFRRGQHHVRGTVQPGHQHPHDLHQRDQDQRHHRQERRRPRCGRHPRRLHPLIPQASFPSTYRRATRRSRLGRPAFCMAPGKTKADRCRRLPAAVCFCMSMNKRKKMVSQAPAAAGEGDHQVFFITMLSTASATCSQASAHFSR